MSRFHFSLAFAALLLACSSKETAPVPLVVAEDPSESYLVGIRADEFHCESVLSLQQASEVFGGRVERIESPMSPPTGVPAPCSYRSHEAGREPLGWSFDLDCREGALSDASQLMVSYADAPGAEPMRIGQSALDHNNSVLLFIDDDTPCYGRVMGPQIKIRSQVATLVVKALTPRSAPTGAHLQAR